MSSYLLSYKELYIHTNINENEPKNPLTLLGNIIGHHSLWHLFDKVSKSNHKGGLVGYFIHSGSSPDVDIMWLDLGAVY